MMVKDVTKFHNRHLGVRGILEYICVYVCRVTYRILGLVLMCRVCIVHNN